MKLDASPVSLPCHPTALRQRPASRLYSIICTVPCGTSVMDIWPARQPRLNARRGMIACILCSAAWLTFVPAAHFRKAAAGRAILTGRPPPAGLSLPSPLFAISGLPPIPGSLAAIKPSVLQVGGFGVGVRQCRLLPFGPPPPRGHPYGTVKPSPCRSIRKSAPPKGRPQFSD